jgi:hypothetical protein
MMISDQSLFKHINYIITLFLQTDYTNKQKNLALLKLPESRCYIVSKNSNFDILRKLQLTKLQYITLIGPTWTCFIDRIKDN